MVQLKSFEFALEIIKTFKRIQSIHKEYVLSKQLLKSGTSIGANIEEAIGGQSDRDFFSKICISYKEARETKYWIRLMYECQLLNDSESEELLNKIEELLRIIGSIQKTMKVKIRNSQSPNRN